MPQVHEATQMTQMKILPESAILQHGGVKDQDFQTIDMEGVSVTVLTQYYIIDRSGRKRKPSEFTAFSWTGIALPYDMQAVCANPWLMHSPRMIYPGEDGHMMPESLIFLCNDCVAYNQKLKGQIKALKPLYATVTY